MTRSFTGIPELKESYRKLGPLRFALTMLGTLLYIGIGAALAITKNYPAAYGSSCRRKCFIENYWYSPELLSQGDFYAYALFAWLWSMPALVVGVLIYAALKKRRNKTFL
jgi:hypothetical protein